MSKEHAPALPGRVRPCRCIVPHVRNRVPPGPRLGWSVGDLNAPCLTNLVRPAEGLTHFFHWPEPTNTPNQLHQRYSKVTMFAHASRSRNRMHAAHCAGRSNGVGTLLEKEHAKKCLLFAICCHVLFSRYDNASSEGRAPKHSCAWGPLLTRAARDFEPLGPIRCPLARCRSGSPPRPPRNRTLSCR